MPRYRVSRLSSLAWLLSLRHLVHPPPVISQSLDFSSASTRYAVNGEMVDALPVDRATDVLRFLPGVTTDNAGELLLRGGNPGDAAVYLDGVPPAVRLPIDCLLPSRYFPEPGIPDGYRAEPGRLAGAGHRSVAQRAGQRPGVHWSPPTNTRRSRSRLLKGRATLHLGFNLQTLAVAVNRRGREDFVTPDELHRAIPRIDVAVDLETVPSFGVAYIIDRDVVVLAPEEWHRIEDLLLAKHVSGSSLALSLRHHPVLHPDTLTGMRIGPTRDVTGREHVRRAGLQELIDRYAPVQRESSPFGQLQIGPHANPGHNQVGLQAVAILQHHLTRRNLRCGLLEVEVYSVLLVKFLDEVSQFGTHDPLQWTSLRRHYVHLQLPGPQ